MTRTLSILFLSCLTALGQVSFSFGSLTTVAKGYATNQVAGERAALYNSGNGMDYADFE